MSLAAAGPIRLSDVIGAMSYALDLTEGQSPGHAARSCVIGMRVAEVAGLHPAEKSALLYALLLKDAGCSTNSAKLCALFGHDDRAVKLDRRTVDHTRPGEMALHLWRTVAPGASARARLGTFAALARTGGDNTRAMTEMRCERGADIALSLGLGEGTAEAIRALDELWDGHGVPAGLEGDAIPLLGRVLGLAQAAEVFFSAAGEDPGQGAEAVALMARARRGTWFDPELVDALLSFTCEPAFWDRLREADPVTLVGALEPEGRMLEADEDRVDLVAAAFARVIDAKSPYTFRHSEQVAEIATDMADVLGFEPGERRRLRRAGLLHDVGKLAVSNTILDKPGRLTPAEWGEVRRHPAYTVAVLRRAECFADVVEVAGSHHERLDGSGYHRGLTGAELSAPARVLVVADICEALTADRPYRAGLEPDAVMEILRREAGTGLCVQAVQAAERVLRGPAALVLGFHEPEAAEKQPADARYTAPPLTSSPRFQSAPRSA